MAGLRSFQLHVPAATILKRGLIEICSVVTLKIKEDRGKNLGWEEHLDERQGKTRTLKERIKGGRGLIKKRHRAQRETWEKA